MSFSAKEYYENDDPIFAAHYQSLLLMDIVQNRNVNSHKLLAGSGLFYDDVLNGEKELSAQQLLRLVSNAQLQYKQPDLSFRWGHTLWPGHYDCFSQLLKNTHSLRQTLSIIKIYRHQLSPLITPIITEDKNYCYIQWRDAIGLGDNKRFIIEAWMTGLASLCHWRSQQKLPWHFGFSGSQAKYQEQYQVNLGNQSYFNLGIDVMAIDKRYLNQNWQDSASKTAYNIALRQCELQQNNKLGFIEHVFDHLLLNIQQPLSLDQVACNYQLSSATFKRKLKKHHTSYQQLQDQARLSTALYLFQCNKYTNMEVAEYLNFSDLTNFRRAFKRWSGRTPSNLKQDLLNPA